MTEKSDKNNSLLYSELQFLVSFNKKKLCKFNRFLYIYILYFQINIRIHLNRKYPLLTNKYVLAFVFYNGVRLIFRYNNFTYEITSYT